MSHILSGRCLAKIDWKSADPSNLTALCYNEVRAFPRIDRAIPRTDSAFLRTDSALPRTDGTALGALSAQRAPA